MISIYLFPPLKIYLRLLYICFLFTPTFFRKLLFAVSHAICVWWLKQLNWLVLLYFLKTIPWRSQSKIMLIPITSQNNENQPCKISHLATTYIRFNYTKISSLFQRLVWRDSYWQHLSIWCDKIVLWLIYSVISCISWK